VYTADASGTMAEAVAVRGNQILRVGSNREINRLRRPQTVVIDANGAAILPGFDDTSTHFIDGGMALDEVDLSDATTIEELQARIEAWATSHPDRSWILGRGWQASTFSGGPTHQLLDAVAPDRPAYLLSADGRSAWLNLKALQRAGITKRTANPPDGTIVKESRTGQPSGLLKGSAIALASKVLPRVSRDDRERALHAAIEEAHRQGVTSVHDTIDRSDDFILYDDARQAGELAVRVYASVPGDGIGEAELFKELDALSSKYPDDPLFKMGGVRLSIDGGIESLDAAVLQPYETRPDDNGPTHVDPDALNRLVRLIDARGWQITLEASGDRAVRMALDALEHAAKSNKEPEKGRRHRIEGVELVDAVDVPRFGRLRTIAAIRPDEMSPTSERREAWERSMGSERASRAWPAGSLVSARGQLAFGTGWPIHPMDLFGTMQTAVTRATADGLPEGGWAAAERVSVKRAINAFTSVPAYLSFDEQRKGSLKKGMLADLVVLTTDIFDAPEAELNRASVAATIFDGKIVYQRNAKSTN